MVGSQLKRLSQRPKLAQVKGLAHAYALPAYLTGYLSLIVAT